jgi:hypothetical protein
MRILVSSLLLGAAVVALAPQTRAARVHASAPEPAPPPAHAAEVARIRAHLAGVERELLDADVSHLTPAQRAARTDHVAVLREYREAGVFPHNHVVADRAVPVFVDEHGTHCAVGYLMMRDGRSDLVARISRTRNLATVPELADEPGLAAWLDGAGLSLEEAARIQPWYQPIHPADPTATSGAYVAASLVGTGLGGGMIAWNALLPHDRPSRLAGWLGIGVGAADVSLAAIGAHLDRQPDQRVDGAHVLVNLGVGLISGVLGARTLVAAERAAGAARPPSTNDAAGDRAVLRVTPWSPGPAGGAGLRLDVRF